ncbi:hypothetical protein [Parasitella parasitica]|uniref:protein-tyrosine-phosphatase n=1 Tax=Parasitella parasitica TaxID=35722 RepID=A0A0B7N6Q3_9FUNG|nr:hypothetical protein [Parasitella parasitica]
MTPHQRTKSPLGRMLTFIELPTSALRFLILDCPTESTLGFYLEEFTRYKVSHVVRCCQPTYSITGLNDQGIQVHDLPFKDGGIPPPNIINDWLSLIDLEEQSGLETTIAVHCVAGLGRAPVLVAIALIELFDMQPLDAIEFIRRNRRGAFNKPQIAYLDAYKPTFRRKTKNASLKTSFSRMFFRFAPSSSPPPSTVPPKKQQTEELTESQKEAGAILYKKLLSDRNKTLDELQQTQSNLQKNISKIVKKPNTPRAAVAFSLLEDLIDECIFDVLFDVHRDIKQENSTCQICQTKCKHYVKKPGFDVWGKNYTVNNLPSYAPHLEKCLGLSGRQSSRVASRRMGASSPSFSSDDNNAGTASPDSDAYDRNNILILKWRIESEEVEEPLNTGGTYFSRFQVKELRPGERACCPFTSFDCNRSGGVDDQIQIAFKAYWAGDDTDYTYSTYLTSGGWLEFHSGGPGDPDTRVFKSTGVRYNNGFSRTAKGLFLN